MHHEKRQLACPKCGQIVKGVTDDDVIIKAADHLMSVHEMKDAKEQAEMMRGEIREKQPG